jgi:hypothetical protein
MLHCPICILARVQYDCNSPTGGWLPSTGRLPGLRICGLYMMQSMCAGGGGEGRWQREHCPREGEEQGLVVEGEKSKRNREGKGTVLQTWQKII